MIKAVLFDLDGVIVDTIHYHYLAWQKMFEELGGAVAKQDVLLHEGRASREILPIFLEDAGLTLDPKHHHDFIERKRAYYRSIVQVRHYAHVFETVAELRTRGFRTAVVTASARKNMEASLDETQRAYFDFLVTGDEVSRAKPDPEPYLVAMRHFKLQPGDCLVVENAPLGIASAKRAGMTCVAVETTLSAEHLALADVIIHDIRELLMLPALNRNVHRGS